MLLRRVLTMIDSMVLLDLSMIAEELVKTALQYAEEKLTKEGCDGDA